MPRPLAPLPRAVAVASFVLAGAWILAPAASAQGDGPTACIAGDHATSPAPPIAASSLAPDAGGASSSPAMTAPPSPDACGTAAPSPLSDPNASPAASPTFSPAASPAPAVTIAFEAGDPYFRPSEATLPSQGASRIVLTNDGYVTHNLTIDELGIQLVTARGRTESLTIVDPPPGSYAFYCSVSGHREAGMEGTLVVE